MIERYWKNYKWRSEVGYYNIHLQHNLLGRWSVISVWGRDCNRCGRSRIEMFDTLNEAKWYVSLLNRRRRDKYEFIDVNL